MLFRSTAQSAAKQGSEHFNDIEESLQELRALLLGSRFSILIVEVSKLNIKLCTDIMKGYHAHVTVIDSGYQALELLLNQKYQLLITGLEVKFLNGLALVAAVRMSARGNQDIQSILLTSSKLPPLKRNVDPNFFVARDSQFSQDLSRAIETCIGTLQAKEFLLFRSAMLVANVLQTARLPRPRRNARHVHAPQRGRCAARLNMPHASLRA